MINARADRPFDLARITFQLLFLGALIAACFWILRPFLVSLTWAIMIVVATWPLLTWLQARLGGRRGPAVFAMTVALLLVFAVPLYFAAVTVVGAVRHLGDLAHWLEVFTVPRPPAWLESLPAVGPKLAERWQRLAAASPEEVSGFLLPYASGFVLGFVSRMGSVGRLLMDVLLTVLIAGILYSTGDTAARGARRFAHRLAGRQGEASLYLAAQAIRAVALGVIVSAIVLSVLVGVGLAVTGVPFAGILTVVTFLLTVVNIGPIPVLIPAVIWVYAKQGAVWGTVLVIWGIACILIDKVVQPVLIKRGADVPLLLIFAGVIGGLIAFGIIGLFIGPLVLAVAHTLIQAWVSQDHGDTAVEGGDRERASLTPVD